MSGLTSRSAAGRGTAAGRGVAADSSVLRPDGVVAAGDGASRWERAKRRIVEVPHDPRRHLEPRDPHSAAYTAGVLSGTAGIVLLLFAVLRHLQGDDTPLYFMLLPPVVLFVVAGLMDRHTPAIRSAVWVSLPIGGILLTVVMDLSTQDASAAAQVFLCYPVLYAASQLRAMAAGIVATIAMIGDAIVVLTIKPVAEGFTDLVYVSVTLGAMTVLLVRAGIRQDRLVHQLRELATIDPLTGLVTRRVFDDVARSTLAHRVQGAGTALVVIDVDRFKEINDTFGHPVGDDALVHLAQVLAENTRPDATISRLGGDELAILIPNCSFDSAYRRAAQLVEAVRAAPLVLADGQELPITVSIGIAQAPRDASGLRDLYAVADAVLYQAKRDGRDRVGTSETLPDRIGGATDPNGRTDRERTGRGA